MTRGGRCLICLALCTGVVACAEPAPPGPDPDTLAAGVRDAIGTRGRLERQLELAPLLEQLGPANVAAVAAVYGVALPGLGAAEIEIFLDAWCRFDGPAAFDFARVLKPEELRAAGLRAAVHAWALREPPEALATVQGIEASDPALSRKLMIPLVRGWVHADSGGLEQLLLDNEARGDLLNAAIPEIYRRDGAAGLLGWAAALIERSEDATHQWLIFRKTVRAVGLRSPERAARFVLEHHSTDGYARDGVQILALAWLRRDPERAFEWLREEAPAEARAEAVHVAMRRWASRQPQDARTWLETRPTDSFYDAAYDGMARKLGERDHVAALPWCDRIVAGELQQDCLAAVAGHWYGRDPQAAGHWMEQSTLSGDAKAEIRDRWRKREIMSQRVRSQ